MPSSAVEAGGATASASTRQSRAKLLRVAITVCIVGGMALAAFSLFTGRLARRGASAASSSGSGSGGASWHRASSSATMGGSEASSQVGTPSAQESGSSATLAVLRSTQWYDVLKEAPHDHNAFTQGLYVDGDEVVESTGLYGGRSSMRRVNPHTGEINVMTTMAANLFGEGCVPWGDEVFQITWKAKIGIVYDSESLSEKRRFSYSTSNTQGWGITHDGTQFLVTDGSANLHFWDPVTLEETRRVTVTDSKGPVKHLNELEYVKGEVLANIWYSDLIARIDPADGRVIGYIDFSGIHPGKTRHEDVLNGIAYNEADDTLWITGKLWTKMFLVRLKDLDPPFPAV